MSLLLSGDRGFKWSWACCLLVLLVGGCNSAPETIEPPEYEDDFGASFDTEPISEASVAEATLMHKRAQLDLTVGGVFPLESKVDANVGVGGTFGYEVFKNLFMGVKIDYTNLEINKGAASQVGSALTSLDTIQWFDSYDQWDFLAQVDYDLPITRPSADLGALTLRFGLGTGAALIRGDEDKFLRSQLAQAGTTFKLQDVVSFTLRPTVELRMRVWEHGLAFLGIGYSWVAEDRVDVKLNGDRRELNDTANFDSFQVGGGFAFEW